MKKKERIILGEGFIRFYDGMIRDRHFNPKHIPTEKLRKTYCYCVKTCSCKPWKVILER